jgi:hypothetical protein
MRGWKMATEPTLDELLRDEIMVPVMRSAGVDAARLRSMVTDLARRLPVRRRSDCSAAERALLPSAV